MTPNLKLRCHYCAEENIQFIDVDPAEKVPSILFLLTHSDSKVKRYTDSVSSFYSNLTFNKTLKGLKAPKNEEGFKSPNVEEVFNPNPVNFYHTAEKPLEEMHSPGNPVFFYSDGFKRAQIIPKPLSENLYIYNEDQANYQSLSKFAHGKRGNSISENKKSYFQGSHSKMDPRNISESAEFRPDESLNDRDLENHVMDNIHAENPNINEEHQQNHNNEQNVDPEQNNDPENVVNEENKAYFVSSMKTNGEGRQRWLGMQADLGGTV